MCIIDLFFFKLPWVALWGPPPFKSYLDLQSSNTAAWGHRSLQDQPRCKKFPRPTFGVESELFLDFSPSHLISPVDINYFPLIYDHFQPFTDIATAEAEGGGARVVTDWRLGWEQQQNVCSSRTEKARQEQQNTLLP